MRTSDEIRARREQYRLQALEYRHEKQRVEAAACAMVVSVLSWVLGETGKPTVRVKLD